MVGWGQSSDGSLFLQVTKFVILSNIAVINNTGDCSIREYFVDQSMG